LQPDLVLLAYSFVADTVAEDVAVMERMEGGEKFFESEAELRTFAHILGMPDL